MVRFLSLVLLGVVLGVIIVGTIGVYGMKMREAAERVDEPAVEKKHKSVTAMLDDINSRLGPVKTEKVEGELPVPFYFSRMPYPADPDPYAWSFRHKRALNFYTTDWKLPRESPDENGALSQDLTLHIKGQHPATQGQFIEATNQPCRAWVDRPMAQETVTWTGGCQDGLASGSGRLLRSYVVMGAPAEAGYEGWMQRGRAHGQGTTLTPDGYLYEGDHIGGIFAGHGILRDTRWEGVWVYEGQFKAGYPDGNGRLESDDWVANGPWNSGCYSDIQRSVYVLRHSIECPERKSVFQRLLGDD
ncbi:MAG: hypothetical protein AAF439_12680 [Pseudomonadota bacterium]